MRITFLVVALLALLFASPTLPAMAQKRASKPAVNRNFVRRDLGFAFNQPAKWLDAPDLSIPNLVLGLRSVNEERVLENLVARGLISVSVQDSSTSTLPADFAEKLNAEYKKRPDYTYAGSAKFKVGGVPATSLAFQVREPLIGAVARIRQVWIARNKRLYTFTLIARIDDFDSYVGDFDKMMASVQWLPTK